MCRSRWRDTELDARIFHRTDQGEAGCCTGSTVRQYHQSYQLPREASIAYRDNIRPTLLPHPFSPRWSHQRCHTTLRMVSRDDDWTAFAPPAMRAATPFRAIYLPSRPSRVRIPSPAPIPQEPDPLDESFAVCAALSFCSPGWSQ